MKKKTTYLYYRKILYIVDVIVDVVSNYVTDIKIFLIVPSLNIGISRSTYPVIRTFIFHKRDFNGLLIAYTVLLYVPKTERHMVNRMIIAMAIRCDYPWVIDV